MSAAAFFAVRASAKPLLHTDGEIFRHAEEGPDFAGGPDQPGWNDCYCDGKSTPTWATDADHVAKCWARVNYFIESQARTFAKVHVPEIERQWPARLVGSYLNEGDFHEQDWQAAYWGSHYPGLLRVKERVDPDGLFVCHHCVGSERWDEQGNCPR